VRIQTIEITMNNVVIVIISQLGDINSCIFINGFILIEIGVLFDAWHCVRGQNREEADEGEEETNSPILNVLAEDVTNLVDLIVRDAFIVIVTKYELEGMAVIFVAFHPQFKLASSCKVLAVGLIAEAFEFGIKNVDL